MLTEYLSRGVKAGLVAGFVFALFLAFVANPLVAYADDANHAASEESHAFEEGHAAEEGHAHDTESGHDGAGGHHDSAVSATVTRAVSVVAGGLWAVLLGGVVFGVGFYFLEPAIPGTGAAKSYVLAFAGFVTVSGAPWLALPPAAPGAEQSLAVETRLLLYGGMMVAGALVCVLAGHLYTRLSRSRGRATAAVAALLPFGLLAIPAVLVPSNAVEGALSSELRAGLTGLFVFGQILVWLLLAAAHAQLGPSDGSHGDDSTAIERSPATTGSSGTAD